MVYFSEGLEATACQGAAHQIQRGQVVFKTIPSLAPGGEIAVKVHTRADKADSHVFRAEVVCQSPQMKLASEESTLFYGDDGATDNKPSRLSTSSESDQEELRPIESTGSSE